MFGHWPVDPPGHLAVVFLSEARTGRQDALDEAQGGKSYAMGAAAASVTVCCLLRFAAPAVLKRAARAGKARIFGVGGRAWTWLRQ